MFSNVVKKFETEFSKTHSFRDPGPFILWPFTKLLFRQELSKVSVRNMLFTLQFNVKQVFNKSLYTENSSRCQMRLYDVLFLLPAVLRTATMDVLTI